MEAAPARLPSTDEIRERHARLLERLRREAQRAGHDPDALRVVAVTKGWPISVAHAALEAGLTILGENRVQEALPKVAALPGAEWHLVGRLQSNKARKAAGSFRVIHSVDSLDLIRRLETAAADEGRGLCLLLQVNLSADTAKAGFEADGFAVQATGSGELAAALRELRHATPVGLMTMARLGSTPSEARATFRRLRELRDQLQERSGVALPELSMGMSADAEAAAAEGATLVRIGTALFGPRPA